MHGRLTLATLAAFALLAAPAAAELPVGNLVVNPGAEAAAGATDESAQPAVPGWAITGTLTAVGYGVTSFPTAETATRLGGGANFFAGGPGADVSTAEQVVDVSGAAPEIDAGGVSATLQALLGGWESQDDNAQVAALPLDAAGASLAAATVLPPVLATQRNSETTLVLSRAVVPLPAGTRAVRITLTATRTSGFYNDGYADNVAFFFGELPAAGRSVTATVVSGTVLVRSGKRFVPLDPSLLRNGAEVDARRGEVAITRADGGSAKFSKGIFKLGHEGGITTVTLSQALSCSKARRASAAATKVKTRRLWGDGKGKFRTKGRYSAATVRGTRWLVQDTCTSTLTRVTQGSVTVRDTVRRRNVVVRAGKRYTARPRR